MLRRILFTFTLLILAVSGWLAATARGPAAVGMQARAPSTRHYEYVFPRGAMDVYDIDHHFRLVKHVSLPQTLAGAGVRGAAASPRTGMLYISYGDSGGNGSVGYLMKFDLVHSSVVWERRFPFGVDSMDISPDGRTIYLPTGEISTGNTWNVVDAGDGSIVGTIQGARSPHNTVVSLSGAHVYLGGRNDDFLLEASTRTRAVVQRLGPLKRGVRPFTLNGRESLAFTTADYFLGFQVSSIKSGQVLYTVPVPGFDYSPTPGVTTPSHGIGLTPNEKEIWLVDQAHDMVHVFDVSHLPRAAPRLVASVKLKGSMQGEESPCTYDCVRDGWIGMSRSGRYVFVGDAGDVIDTRTRRTVTVLPALRNTRIYLEIDFRAGKPVAATRREAVGYRR